MMIADFCKTHIEFATIDRLKEYISRIKQNTLIFCSKTIANKFEINQAFAANHLIYTDITPNPTEKSIVEMLSSIGSFMPEIVYAIGGGSVIDLAKAYLAFNDSNINGNNIIEYLNSDKVNFKDGIQFVAVPTSAGTGSEVTQWATIWDSGSLVKYSIDNPKLKPSKAVLIPEFILNAPKDFVLSTGLDALSHALEAFWARATNPLVQQLALKSIEIITKNLREFLDNATIDGATKLYSGATLAGIAFSQTRTTAAHAISYPLTQMFNIPHGYAVALLLPPITKINLKNGFDNSEQLSKMLAERGGITEIIDSISNGIQQLRLRNFGVKTGDFESIAANINLSRLSNNPIALTKDMILRILSDIY